MRDLVELAVDVREGVAQLGAEAVHDGDDGDRDTGGNEAIFDGRRARLVLGEALNEGLHGWAPLVHTWLSEHFPPGLVL